MHEQIKREALFRYLQFPIRNSQYDLNVVGEMVLGKTKIAQSVNVIQRQATRRMKTHSELSQTNTKAQHFLQKFMRKRLESSKVSMQRPMTGDYSVGNSEYPTKRQKENLSCKRLNADMPSSNIQEETRQTSIGHEQIKA